ncbi:MAG: phage tail tape measure protein, partial [Nitratireductor sp.]
MDDTARIDLEFDAESVRKVFDDLKSLSDDFGARLTNAFKRAAFSGRALEDVLRRLALSLSEMALGKALAPLQNLIGAGMSGLFDMLLKAVPHAKGGVPGRPTRFATGGVVSQPTYFPMRGGLGLMGEAGAEAILPLARGADGRLGVAAGGTAPPVNIVFNVTT